METGALVWYRQTCVGGYGFQRKVPAVFLRLTPRRVRIEVLHKDGSRVAITVAPGNVFPREPGESIEWLQGG